VKVSVVWHFWAIAAVLLEIWFKSSSNSSSKSSFKRMEMSRMFWIFFALRCSRFSKGLPVFLFFCRQGHWQMQKDVVAIPWEFVWVIAEHSLSSYCRMRHKPSPHSLVPHLALNQLGHPSTTSVPQSWSNSISCVHWKFFWLIYLSIPCFCISEYLHLTQWGALTQFLCFEGLLIDLGQGYCRYLRVPALDVGA
jgi:hypothetical protein